jgi:hypothetical protein
MPYFTRIKEMDRVGFEPTTSQPNSTFLSFALLTYAVCCFSFFAAATIIEQLPSDSSRQMDYA